MGKVPVLIKYEFVLNHSELDHIDWEKYLSDEFKSVVAGSIPSSSFCFKSTLMVDTKVIDIFWKLDTNSIKVQLIAIQQGWRSPNCTTMENCKVE